MRWWSFFGAVRMLTERTKYNPPVEVSSIGRIFRRSLFIFPVDAGNSNALNMEIAAMKTAQYNVHRLGIFFTDTPRHADLFVLLGDPIPSLGTAVAATLLQAPRPFGVVWVREPGVESTPSTRDEVERIVSDSGGVLTAVLEELTGPEDLIGVMQEVMKGGKR